MRRFVFLILGVMMLAQCATGEDRRFQVGGTERAFVIIGVAEAAESREARYSLLWRQVDANGAFADLTGRATFEAATNQGSTIRVRGIPGEFTLLRVEPGRYALDSVYGVIRGEGVDYVADGVVQGPERPSFDVQPGEAIYLGIWQVAIEDSRPVTRLWRVDEGDLRAVLNHSDEVHGQVRIRQTSTRSVACSPHPLNSRTHRQVC